MNLFKIMPLLFFLFLIGCGDKKKTADDFTKKDSELTPFELKFANGKKVYERTCQACHMADGNGVQGSFPPLSKSDFFANDKLKMVSNIVNGIKGEIIVNGITYNTEMPRQAVTDQEVADVATYVLNSFGNQGGEVTMDDVLSVKK